MRRTRSSPACEYNRYPLAERCGCSSPYRRSQARSTCALTPRRRLSSPMRSTAGKSGAMTKSLQATDRGLTACARGAYGRLIRQLLDGGKTDEEAGRPGRRPAGGRRAELGAGRDRPVRPGRGRGRSRLRSDQPLQPARLRPGRVVGGVPGHPAARPAPALGHGPVDDGARTPAGLADPLAAIGSRPARHPRAGAPPPTSPTTLTTEIPAEIPGRTPTPPRGSIVMGIARTLRPRRKLAAGALIATAALTAGPALATPAAAEAPRPFGS